MHHEIPIPTLPLFPKLDQLLLEFLQSLEPADWHKPTIVPHWTIRDIAAHLLDGNIRTLSMSRDQFFGETPDPIESYSDLVTYLNRLNADWVKAFKRVSPAVLIELLALTGVQYNNYLNALDPMAPALFSVAWAGEEESLNWFHTAREFTEKWHHQQQMRLAMGQEAALYSPELYLPYLETSMRALPHHYRDTTAEVGATIAFSVSGVPDAIWFLQRHNIQWQLTKNTDVVPVSSVVLPADIAWRLFTKGISKAEATQHIQIQGRESLGTPILDVLAVMA